MTLLVGQLSDSVIIIENKIKTFENIVIENTNEKISRLQENVIDNNRKIESTFETFDTIQEESSDLKHLINARFLNIQRNLQVMDETIGNFTTEEYNDFKEHVNEELRLLHNAIFLPDDEDTDGSEY